MAVDRTETVLGYIGWLKSSRELVTELLEEEEEKETNSKRRVEQFRKRFTLCRHGRKR